ncbi:hypothetical protein [Sphingomonas lenta]|uniref:hypothetical protein n=1 Tax=Sphingomonas lenta TaxID=1141887 RepID=UPI00159513A6|nr:hypothetical protein [Sphingomonas lenta]
MADETNDTPAPAENKPAPRRRPPRKAAPKNETPSKPAAKRASRPSTAAPKKPAATRKAPERKSAPKSDAAKSSSRTDRARQTLNKAADSVGGKRNVGLIAGGLAVAGAAAAALLSLRGSTPKRNAVPANDTSAKAHQPDGTDSSGQMEAMIADESMIPESTPKA